MSKNKLDAEYNSMRRRMSRLRVQQGKSACMEAEDVDDDAFADLVKFWKKHGGAPFAREMLPAALHEQGKQYSKQRGRRKSKELEDLDIDPATGKFQKSKRITDPGLEPVNEHLTHKGSSKWRKANDDPQKKVRTVSESSGKKISKSPISTTQEIKKKVYTRSVSTKS